MKKTMNIWKVLAGSLPFLLAACTSDGSVPKEPEAEAKNQVLLAVDDFEAATPSRTTTYLDNETQKYKVKWASGDAVGVFPYEGYQEPFTIPAEQIDRNYATFDGGYWALKEGLTYNAYYPFSVKNFSSANAKTAIPVSYEGQTQEGSTYGVGAYDYTYADWQTATKGGSVTFNFHHIGCLVIFHVTYPATADYTQLALSTGGAALIPTEGTYDLTYNKDKTPEEGQTYVKIPFVADNNSKATSLSMELTNCNGTQGGTNTFYMMMPPVDLTSTTLSLVLTDSNDNTYSCELTSTKFMAGEKYEFTIAPIELGNLTASPWTEVPAKDLPGLETE